MNGLEQIKGLERMYEDAPPEIREKILSRVMEIESEIACGCMFIVYRVHHHRRKA